MDYIRILGLIAATLTTISFFPQAIKIIKTRDARSISLGMYSILVLGIAMWVVYGFLVGDLPILLANIITLIPTLVILVIKIRETARK